MGAPIPLASRSAAARKRSAPLGSARLPPPPPRLRERRLRRGLVGGGRGRLTSARAGGGRGGAAGRAGAALAGGRGGRGRRLRAAARLRGGAERRRRRRGGCSWARWARTRPRTRPPGAARAHWAAAGPGGALIGRRGCPSKEAGGASGGRGRDFLEGGHAPALPLYCGGGGGSIPPRRGLTPDVGVCACAPRAPRAGIGDGGGGKWRLAAGTRVRIQPSRTSAVRTSSHRSPTMRPWLPACLSICVLSLCTTPGVGGQGAAEDCCLGLHARGLPLRRLRLATGYRLQRVSGSCNLQAVMHARPEEEAGTRRPPRAQDEGARRKDPTLTHAGPEPEPSHARTPPRPPPRARVCKPHDGARAGRGVKRASVNAAPSEK
ncbi:C-C motif chemokine 25 [Meriones unguiculatus]|uniref:C-C motif chemokine 25 n=1 Tax=Meriones unguiculatus TaxID=10047 RepID=UPI00293E4596|nr:C-C motif chemokine 25 [Meriones unguiculatus]